MSVGVSSEHPARLTKAQKQNTNAKSLSTVLIIPLPFITYFPFLIVCLRQFAPLDVSAAVFRRRESGSLVAHYAFGRDLRQARIQFNPPYPGIKATHAVPRLARCTNLIRWLRCSHRKAFLLKTPKSPRQPGRKLRDKLPPASIMPLYQRLRPSSIPAHFPSFRRRGMIMITNVRLNITTRSDKE